MMADDDVIVHVHGGKAFINAEFVERMLEGKPVYVCDLPPGSHIAQMQSADPLVQRFIAVHPEHRPRIIEIGPTGVTVTDVEYVPDEKAPDQG